MMMGRRRRNAADSTAAQKIRKVVAVALTAGALVSAVGGSAFADVLSAPLNGQKNTDQDGEQNLNCGNSARLVRVNLVETVNRERVCVDTDGRTRRYSGPPGGARTEGGVTLGPQVNTAQTGRQNLNCGNSADQVTVNALGTMNQETTCVAMDRHHASGRDRGHGRGEHVGGARTEGGVTLGPQVNTAQTGRQNLNCGNSADQVTVNVLGTIRRHTTCIAADQSRRSGPAATRRGQASTDTDLVVGSETNTAQNGRQNQTCGSLGTAIDLPLGRTERRTECTVEDNSGPRAR
jgi:hypothetical protein